MTEKRPKGRSKDAARQTAALEETAAAKAPRAPRKSRAKASPKTAGAAPKRAGKKTPAAELDVAQAPQLSVHERLMGTVPVAPEVDTAPAGPSVQLVTFMLEGEEYAIPIMQVQEIIRMFNVRVTPIPNAPRFIEGVINLRGRILPVVDLRDRFGMPAQERTRSNRIIVVGVGGRTHGLVVDAVVEVLRIFEERIVPLPELASGVGTEYVVGVTHLGDRMVIALDLERVFSDEENVSVSLATGADRGDSR